MSTTTEPWHATPLIESVALSIAARCRVHLKLENLQPSGSFKSRGIGHYMRVRLAERQSTSPSTDAHTHFYSSSGGNAGLAAVHASRALGLPCTVVIPLTTQPLMIAKLYEAGAHNVVQKGASWREADTYLREELLASDKGGVYVPPFDHPDIWTGNASMVRELHGQWIEQIPTRKPPAAIVCSVGGGGLLCGLMQGLHGVGNGWENIPVIALETIGADSLNQSVKADTLVTLPAITSLARCLGATRVAERAFEWATGRISFQDGKTTIVSATLTDAEATMGCLKLADTQRLLVELACGVNVAVCFDGRLEQLLGRRLGEDEEIIVVICGGSDVTLASLAEMKDQFKLEIETIQNVN